MGQTALYRHFDADGRLLYVGISLSAVQRLAQHATSDWSAEIRRVEVETFPDRVSAATAERESIRREQPIYNKRRYPEPPTHVARRPLPPKFLVGMKARTHLAQYQARVGVSQTELARQFGISRSYLAEIQSGAKRPSRTAISKIALGTKGAVSPQAWFAGAEIAQSNGSAA